MTVGYHIYRNGGFLPPAVYTGVVDNAGVTSGRVGDRPS